MRTMWIKDVVKTTNGVHYIPGNWKEMVEKKEQYEAVWSQDSQKERLMKEWDNGSGWVEAPCCISMGNSGCSFLEPFVSMEEALKWIEEEKDYIYFGKWTHPELKKIFPDIPIQMHPSEYEKDFGIWEKSK